MKKLLFLLTLFLFIELGVVFTVEAQELILADQGKSDYRIVIPVNPSPIQKSASGEFQKIFKQITGVELPIVSETDADQNSKAKNIVIGPSKTSAALLKENETKYQYDKIRLKRIDNTIILSGHPTRGPIYAVNTFLEDWLGCRWWTSVESTIPKKETVKVDTIDLSYNPKLIYRESFYRDSYNGPFAVKMKCNGGSNNITKEWGGHHQYQYFVHSFYPLIPPHKYFLKHPDWFPEIDGVRKVGVPGWAGVSPKNKELFDKLDKKQIHEAGTQLCLTNEEMRKELVKNALEALEKNPNATFISISQNDWHGYCTCPKCKAIADEEGAQSGVLLRFVNKVAEDIEKKHPNIMVDTLAYQYTRKPPKMTRPRHNVVVRLCSIECDFGTTLAQGQENSKFRDDMNGWAKMADKIFVWDYVTDFTLYLLPFPNYHVWSSNINFYIDHSVVGLFEQGDYHTESGDFIQLRNWVMSKLLWNPKQDQKVLMSEFIAGYYAPELVPVYLEYFETLSNAIKSSGKKLGIFRPTTSDWFTYDAVYKATQLQDKALKIAKELQQKDPKKYANLVQKVERERIPLDIVWLQDYRLLKMESQMTGKPFNGPADPHALAVSFAKKIDLNGITRYREHNDKISVFTQSFLDRYDKDLSNAVVPEIVKSLPKERWIDIQEMDMNLFKQGDFTFTEKDENASNKRAVRMPGTHFEWATSWNIPAALNKFYNKEKIKAAKDGKEKLPNYHLYLYVRCDAKKAEGPAMTAGIYNSKEKKGVCHKAIDTAQIKGQKYVMIDMGITPLNEDMYFWAAPARDHKDNINNVYIDRLVLVREK